MKIKEKSYKLPRLEDFKKALAKSEILWADGNETCVFVPGFGAFVVNAKARTPEAECTLLYKQARRVIRDSRTVESYRDELGVYLPSSCSLEKFLGGFA